MRVLNDLAISAGALVAFLEGHMGTITAIVVIVAIMQWRETRRSNERQLRAYVTVSSAGIVEIAGGWSGAITLQNSGVTPATDVESWICMDILPLPLADGATLPTPPNAPLPTGKSVIASQGTTTLNVVHASQLPKPSAVNKTAVYMWGEIKYRDVFRAQRTTRFRLYKTDGVGLPSSAPCFTHEGNGID